jgi:small subunit ribosomal protein S18
MQQIKRSCFFCQEKIEEIDYKNVSLLKKFISPRAKILPVRRTGTCTKHQRKLSQAIKRARRMALLPFVLR